MKPRLAATAIALWCAHAAGAPPVAARPLPDSRVLFAVALTTPAGGTASLADARGRPMIVNFWARWCTPCRTEIPELVRAQRLHPGVAIVGIDIDEQPDAVRDFATAYEMKYRLLITRGDGIEMLKALGNSDANLPYTLAINRRGAIVGRHLGVMHRSDLQQLLGSLR